MTLAIPTTTLPTGSPIPVLAYGVGTAWGSDNPEAPINRVLVDCVKKALELGYRHIDCAECYNTEREVGVAIKESGIPREELFITTKLFPNVTEPEKALKASMEKLGVDYVDLYLLHCPFFNTETFGIEVADVYARIVKLQSAGLARTIGVSNFNVPQLKKLLETAEVKPAVNQIELHPNCHDEELLAYMKEQGIQGEAYTPLAPIVRLSGGDVDRVVSEIAEKRGITKAQVLIKWVMQKGFVVISTTSKEERMVEFAQLKEDLSEEEIGRITAEGRKLYKKFFWTMYYEQKG